MESKLQLRGISLQTDRFGVPRSITATPPRRFFRYITTNAISSSDGSSAAKRLPSGPLKSPISSRTAPGRETEDSLAAMRAIECSTHWTQLKAAFYGISRLPSNHIHLLVMTQNLLELLRVSGGFKSREEIGELSFFVKDIQRSTLPWLQSNVYASLEVASLLYCFLQLGQVPDEAWMVRAESALAFGLQSAIDLKQSQDLDGSNGWVLTPDAEGTEDLTDEDEALRSSAIAILTSSWSFQVAGYSPRDKSWGGLMSTSAIIAWSSPSAYEGSGLEEEKGQVTPLPSICIMALARGISVGWEGIIPPPSSSSSEAPTPFPSPSEYGPEWVKRFLQCSFFNLSATVTLSSETTSDMSSPDNTNKEEADDDSGEGRMSLDLEEIMDVLQALKILGVRPSSQWLQVCMTASSQLLQKLRSEGVAPTTLLSILESLSALRSGALSEAWGAASELSLSNKDPSSSPAFLSAALDARSCIPDPAWIESSLEGCVRWWEERQKNYQTKRIAIIQRQRVEASKVSTDPPKGLDLTAEDLEALEAPDVISRILFELGTLTRDFNRPLSTRAREIALVLAQQTQLVMISSSTVEEATPVQPADEAGRGETAQNPALPPPPPPTPPLPIFSSAGLVSLFLAFSRLSLLPSSPYAGKGPINEETVDSSWIDAWASCLGFELNSSSRRSRSRFGPIDAAEILIESSALPSPTSSFMAFINSAAESDDTDKGSNPSALSPAKSSLVKLVRLPAELVYQLSSVFFASVSIVTARFDLYKKKKASKGVSEQSPQEPNDQELGGGVSLGADRLSMVLEALIAQESLLPPQFMSSIQKLVDIELWLLEESKDEMEASLVKQGADPASLGLDITTEDIQAARLSLAVIKLVPMIATAPPPNYLTSLLDKVTHNGLNQELTVDLIESLGRIGKVAVDQGLMRKGEASCLPIAFSLSPSQHARVLCAFASSGYEPCDQWWDSLSRSISSSLMPQGASEKLPLLSSTTLDDDPKFDSTLSNERNLGVLLASHAALESITGIGGGTRGRAIFQTIKARACQVLLGSLRGLVANEGGERDKLRLRTRRVLLALLPGIAATNKGLNVPPAQDCDLLASSVLWALGLSSSLDKTTQSSSTNLILPPPLLSQQSLVIITTCLDVLGSTYNSDDNSEGGERSGGLVRYSLPSSFLVPVANAIYLSILRSRKEIKDQEEQEEGERQERSMRGFRFQLGPHDIATLSDSLSRSTLTEAEYESFESMLGVDAGAQASPSSGQEGEREDLWNELPCLLVVEAAKQSPTFPAVQLVGLLESAVQLQSERQSKGCVANRGFYLTPGYLSSSGALSPILGSLASASDPSLPSPLPPPLTCTLFSLVLNLKIRPPDGWIVALLTPLLSSEASLDRLLTSDPRSVTNLFKSLDAWGLPSLTSQSQQQQPQSQQQLKSSPASKTEGSRPSVDVLLRWTEKKLQLLCKVDPPTAVKALSILTSIPPPPPPPPPPSTDASGTANGGGEGAAWKLSPQAVSQAEADLVTALITGDLNIELHAPLLYALAKAASLFPPTSSPSSSLSEGGDGSSTSYQPDSENVSAAVEICYQSMAAYSDDQMAAIFTSLVSLAQASKKQGVDQVGFLPRKFFDRFFEFVSPMETPTTLISGLIMACASSSSDPSFQVPVSFLLGLESKILSSLNHYSPIFSPKDLSIMLSALIRLGLRPSGSTLQSFFDYSLFLVIGERDAIRSRIMDQDRGKEIDEAKIPPGPGLIGLVALMTLTSNFGFVPGQEWGMAARPYLLPLVNSIRDPSAKRAVLAALQAGTEPV